MDHGSLVPREAQGDDQLANVGVVGSATVNLSTRILPDGRQFVCWTPDLKDRLDDAVMRLGGPLRATPKHILRIMGVPGLTADHVKSKLQKLRLGWYLPKFAPAADGSKDDENGSGDGLNMNSSPLPPPPPPPPGLQINEPLRRRLEGHELAEVQRQLHMRLEIQEKYMQMIEHERKVSGVLIASKEISEQVPFHEAFATGTSSPKKKQKVDDGSGRFLVPLPNTRLYF